MLSSKLFLSFIYNAIVVSLYYCYCVSQSIPTALMSSRLVESDHNFDDFGLINRAAANLFAHYSIPQNTGPAIIASMPSEEVPNFLKKTYNIKKLSTKSDQKPNYGQPIEIPVTYRVSSVPNKYNGQSDGSDYDISTRITSRPVRVTSIKHISRNNPNTFPRPLKSQSISSKSTTSQPLYHTFKVEKSTTIQPKYKFHTTSTQVPISTSVKIHSIKTTEKPRTTQQPQQQQYLHLKHRKLEQKQNLQHLQQQQQLQQSTHVSLKSEPQLQDESHEQQQQLNPKHILESDKKEKEQISSEGSEDNYQLNFYNEPKNYEISEHVSDRINSYSPEKDESLSLGNPETHQYYDNSEPEPEPEPEVFENEKLIQSPNTDDKNSLKLLLEQFVRQLDNLKSVAEIELYKVNSETNSNNDYTYKDIAKENSDLIASPVVQTSVTNNGAAYDEYQNERSNEQTAAIALSKTYKDTNQNNGRYRTIVKLLHNSLTNPVSNYMSNSYLSSINSDQKSVSGYFVKLI